MSKRAAWLLIVVICLHPPDDNGKPYKAWRLRDSPAAIAARKSEAAEAGEIPAGLDSVLADALVAYQQSLIAAMDDIHSELNATREVISDAGEPQPVVEKERAPDPLLTRLETLERSGKKLRDEIANLEKEIAGLVRKVDEFSDGRKPVLQSVYSSVEKVQSKSKGKGKKASSKTGAEGKAAKSAVAAAEETFGLNPVLGVVGVGILIVAAYVVRRRRGGRDLSMKAK